MDITEVLLAMAPEIRRRYRRKMRCLRQRVSVDDLIQDFYLKAWKHRHSCNGTTPAEVRRWLRVVAANVFRATINKHLECANRSLQRERRFTADCPIQCDPSERMETEEAKQEAKQSARKVIKQLPSRHQLAVKLRFLKELEYHEVASAMGISEHRARSLAATGVRRLRQMA